LPRTTRSRLSFAPDVDAHSLDAARVEDLGAIVTYIEHDRPRAARLVAAKVDQYAGLIGRYPEVGRVGRVPGTREVVVAGMPFVLVYRITSSDIQLLRVLHTALQYP
jgi:toxin ParE1/3/4